MAYISFSIGGHFLGGNNIDFFVQIEILDYSAVYLKLLKEHSGFCVSVFLD